LAQDGVLEDRYTWLEEGIIDHRPGAGRAVDPSSPPGPWQRPTVARRVVHAR